MIKIILAINSFALIKYSTGFFLFLLLLCIKGFTQQNDTTYVIVEDSYIEKMNEKINLKLAQTNSIETFSVKTNNSVYLRPNTSTLAKMFLNYRALSLTLTYNPEFIPGNDDDLIRGKTTGAGFGLGFTFDQWFTEASYSKTKGYYLKNTADYIPGWTTGDEYTQFPKLISKIYEGMTGYSFNPNFSLAAITTQTTRQLKSTGSFQPKLMYRYYIVDDQSGGSSSQKSKNFQSLAGVTYWHTFVVNKKFYFSLGLTPAIGFVSSKIYTRMPSGTYIINGSTPVYMLDGRGGIGFNGERFFAGFYTRATSITHKQKNTTAIDNNATSAYQAFIGYRFGAPKFLQNTYDDIFNRIKKQKAKNHQHK